MLKRLLILSALMCLGATTLAPARLAAQEIDYVQRAADLESLARIFGELHHIRRSCEPNREAEVWRNRMRKLVELEQPQQALRDKMVAAFNAGFRAAEQRFPYCDRAARDHAAALAVDGDAVTRRLAAPLYESLSEGGDTPTVWRGDDRR